MKRFRCYPLLLAAYPVLALFAANLGQVRLKELWVPLLITVGVAAVLNLLLTPALKDTGKASLVTALLVLSFFSYRHFVDFLRDLPFYLPAGLIFAGVIIGVLTAILYLTRRAGKRLTAATRILTVSS